MRRESSSFLHPPLFLSSSRVFSRVIPASLFMPLYGPMNSRGIIVASFVPFDYLGTIQTVRERLDTRNCGNVGINMIFFFSLRSLCSDMNKCVNARSNTRECFLSSIIIRRATYNLIFPLFLSRCLVRALAT